MGQARNNPGVGRKAGTLVRRAGTECEKNSRQSLIIREKIRRRQEQSRR